MEVVGIISNILAKCANWNLAAVIPQGDVEAAFDQMTQDNVAMGLSDHEVDCQIIAAIFKGNDRSTSCRECARRPSGRHSLHKGWATGWHRYTFQLAVLLGYFAGQSNFFLICYASLYLFNTLICCACVVICYDKTLLRLKQIFCFFNLQISQF